MVDKNKVVPSTSKHNLKLKISKKASQESIPKTLQTEPSKNKNYVCRECNRSFRSGKALGGHMSIAHVQSQANKDLPQKNLQFNKKTNLGARCKICARYFHSKKSLNGHMKSHPDRHWRGMDTPQDDENSEDSLDYLLFISDKDENESEKEKNVVDYVSPIMDLSASLRKWGVTDKRGRIKPDSESDEEEDELCASVRQVISLVNFPWPKKAEVVVQNWASGSGRWTKKMVVGENDELVKKSTSIAVDDGVGNGRKAKCAKVGASNNGSDAKLKSPTTQEKALGGHWSSHSKPLVSISSTIGKVDTYNFGSCSKEKTSSERGHSKLFIATKGVLNRGIDLVDMVPYNDQATTENESTLVNVVDRTPYNIQATLGCGSTQGYSVDMATYNSQATFGNESNQGRSSDRDSSSDQATSTHVRAQVPKPKVFIDLNQFLDEDEI